MSAVTAATLVGLEHVLVRSCAARRECACRSGSPRSTSSSRRACASGRPSLDGRELARDADADAEATFADVWKSLRRDGRGRRSGCPRPPAAAAARCWTSAVALEACAHELVPGPLLGVAVAAACSARPSCPSGRRSWRHRARSTPVWDAPVGDPRSCVDADGWRLLPRSAVELDRRDRRRPEPPVRAGGSLDAAAGVAVPEPDRGRCCAGPRSRSRAAEAAGRRALVPGDRGRVRQGARAVRPADRQPSRRSSTCARRCSRPPRRSPPRPGTSRPLPFGAGRRAVGVRRRRRGGVALRRRGRGRQGLHPGARRHRLHLRARRAPLPAPGAGAARAGRRRRRRGRAADRRRGRRRTPPGATSTSRAATSRSGRRSGPRVERIAALPADERRAALVETGYLTPHWPAPYGLGADAVTQIVIDEELARAGVARPDIVIAGWALPTILEHGTDEQRERFVTAVAARRPGLVPAVLRAGRRLRPGVAAHPGRARSTAAGG